MPLRRPRHLRTLAIASAVGAALSFGFAAPAAADERPVLRIAVQKDPVTNTVDPQREISNVGTRIVHNIFDSLIRIDYADNYRLKPGLAAAWKRIDGRTLELTLRQGVKFHDGGDFTAEDVAFTLSPERILAKTWPGKMRVYWSGLDRIDVVDTHTVRVIMKTDDPVLEYRLAAAGSGIISKKAFEAASSLDAWGRKPVGTGPYRVADYRSGEAIVLAAFDDYWDGKPPAREVRWINVPEVAARVSGLVAGEYDIATNVPPDQLATIDRYDNLETVGGPIGNHHVLMFDTRNEQLKDVQLRRALSLAIDRQLIIDSLWAGRTTLPRSHQWSAFGDFYDANRAKPEYNPALAKKLVKQSSYNGEVIPFRIKNNYYTNEVARAQILAEMWEKVGIKVKIEIKEKTKQLYGGIRNWSNSMHYPDPVGAIVRNWGPKSAADRRKIMTNIDTEPFFAASTLLRTSVDKEKRLKAFGQVLDFWDNQLPGTVLHQFPLHYGKRKDIQWTVIPDVRMELRPAALGFGGS